MKTLRYLYLLLFIGVMASCAKEQHGITTPQIRSLQFTPAADIVYGEDSLEVTATVGDNDTPLSTFYVEVNYGGAVVYSKHIRTKGNEAKVTHRFPLPFAAKALDNTDVNVVFKSINIEGGEVAETKTFKAKRPVLGDTLYVKFDDNSVLKLAKLAGHPMSYESPTKIYYKNSMNFTVSDKEDFSGIVWNSDNNQIVTHNTAAQPIALKDYTIKIEKFVFDTELFLITPSGPAMPKFSINGTILELNSDYYSKFPVFMKSIKFEKGKEVPFAEITNMATAYNPDFFSFADGKLTFVAETGTYQVVYVEEWNYLFLTQPDATYPDCLWACGTGLAQPRWIPDMTNSWWDFGFINSIYFRKVSDKVFQATLWLNSSDDWWFDLDFKLYQNTSWGGEIGSNDFSTYPSIFAKHKAGDIIKGDTFVAGFYRVTVDLNGTAGNYSMKAEKLASLQP